MGSREKGGKRGAKTKEETSGDDDDQMALTERKRVTRQQKIKGTKRRTRAREYKDRSKQPEMSESRNGRGEKK